MSNVHYFPRYSQRENMTTNNTLLLFSRLYNNSNEKFNRFLVSLFEDNDDIEFDTKMNFKQQVKCNNSVPDGLMYQESIKIVVETKLYGQENINQIVNHLDSFNNEDTMIFLFIDKNDISASFKKRIRSEIADYNTNHGKHIKFVATTFKKICFRFEDILDEFDFEMKDLITDFKAFCYESNLINNFDTKIRVVLSGTTFEQNMKTNVYYAPKTRGYQSSKFLGLYKSKSVRAIGEIENIVDVNYIDSEITDIEIHKGILTDEMKNLLIKIIIEAKDEFQYDLTSGSRFFFVKEFLKTDYTKKSSGGLMGTRYFDISDFNDYNEKMNNQEIADLLKKEEWR